MKKKCSKCGLLKDLSDFNNRAISSDGKRPECRLCGKINASSYSVKPEVKKRISDYRKIYDEKNSEKIRKRRNEWFKKRADNDPLFRLSRNLRKRIYRVLKNKKNSYIELIGIDVTELKNYLEIKFQDGMTWDNYGEWHVDHIIPLSSAKNESELCKLCHYTNLQPLWKMENILKSNKLIW
jgi:hypothetical protein